MSFSHFNHICSLEMKPQTFSFCNAVCQHPPKLLLNFQRNSNFDTRHCMSAGRQTVLPSLPHQSFVSNHPHESLFCFGTAEATGLQNWWVLFMCCCSGDSQLVFLYQMAQQATHARMQAHTRAHTLTQILRPNVFSGFYCVHLYWDILLVLPKGCVRQLSVNHWVCKWVKRKSLHISFAWGWACRIGPVLDRWLVGSTCPVLTHVSHSKLCYLQGRRLLADLCYTARISP